VAEQMGDRLETVLRHYGKWIRQDRGRAELSKLEQSAECVENAAEKKSR